MQEICETKERRKQTCGSLGRRTSTAVTEVRLDSLYAFLVLFYATSLHESTTGRMV